MESSLSERILVICKTLNHFSVEYLVVGGTAVGLHGYFRRSINIAGQPAEKPDLDFWYNPTYNNYFRLLNAIESLGQDITRFREEQSPDPKRSFFRFDFDHYTLDFLPEVKAPLKFSMSFKNRESVAIDDIEIPFINYDDLIKDKKANARPKDINDIEHLNTNNQQEDV